nr:MAG TPA: hypothetical protein [Crassvirales sp.]
MVNLQVNYRGGDYLLSLPTTLSEINFEYLNKITQHIHVAPDYALIAVVYKVRPIEIVSSVKQNKNANVGAVAAFIKSNSAPGFYDNIKLGDTVVIAPADIALGHTVRVVNNNLTPTKLLELAETNPDLNKKLIGVMTPTYFVDFKIVATAFIHGSMTKDESKEAMYLVPGGTLM